MSDLSANSWDIDFKSQLGSNPFLTPSRPPIVQAALSLWDHRGDLQNCLSISTLSPFILSSTQPSVWPLTENTIAWNVPKTSPSKSSRGFILGIRMPCPCPPCHPALSLQGCPVLPQPSLESFCRTEVLGIPQIWRVYFVLGAPRMAFSAAQNDVSMDIHPVTFLTSFQFIVTSSVRHLVTTCFVWSRLPGHPFLIWFHLLCTHTDIYCVLYLTRGMCLSPLARSCNR